MKTLIEKSLNKHDFPTKEREKLAKEGEAMKDGSFPIRNEQDLKDAIRSVGRAKDPAAARRWIKKRAKELGKESLLPEDWKEGDDIEKSRAGRYEDTSENRRLHRVGQEYGSKGSGDDEKDKGGDSPDNERTIKALQSKIDQMKKNKHIFVENSGEARYNKALETLQGKLDAAKGEKGSWHKPNGVDSKVYVPSKEEEEKESARDKTSGKEDKKEKPDSAYDKVNEKAKKRDAKRDERIGNKIKDGYFPIGKPNTVAKVMSANSNGSLVVEYTNGDDTWEDTVQPGSDDYQIISDSGRLPKSSDNSPKKPKLDKESDPIYQVQKKKKEAQKAYDDKREKARKAYDEEGDKIRAEIDKLFENDDPDSAKKRKSLWNELKKKTNEYDKETTRLKDEYEAQYKKLDEAEDKLYDNRVKKDEKTGKDESKSDDSKEAFTRVKFEDIPNSGKVNLKKYLSARARKDVDGMWEPIDKIDTQGLKKMEKGLVEDFNRQFEDLPKARRAEKLYAIMKVKGELQKRGNETKKTEKKTTKETASKAKDFKIGDKV